MKKRLLMQLLAVVFAVGAYAVNPGEYIFSNDAKYKVTGTNQVENGNFTVGDGTQGWVNGLGTNLGANWKVAVGAGLNGGNAIESQSASTEDADVLANSWLLTSGLYVITYNIYADEAGVTTISAGSANYVNFFANSTGDNTIERAISAAESYKAGQWTQIVDTIFVNVDQEFLVFNASNVAAGIRFTDFAIYKAEQVYDSRIIDRLIEYAEKLLAEPDLANGQDDFRGILEQMKYAVTDPSLIDSPEGAEALIASFNEEFDKFMNANGGNTVSVTGDWTQRASSGFKGLTTYGAWKFDGGRWGFSANDASCGRPANDGYVATAGIQRGWAQYWPAYIESTSLQKGYKYFFSIEAQAVAASSTNISDNPPYGANHNQPIIGGENYKMFIGTDTLSLEGDTISGYYWKRYYMIAEIPADADAVRAGFIFQFPSSMGERASLRNPEFRLIGKTEIQINYEAALESAALQANETLKRLNTYQADVAGYNWEKDSLERAVVLAREVYENSLLVVKADGSCDLPVTQESIDQLKELSNTLLEDGVRRLNRAKDYVIAQNKIFADVADLIALAEGVRDDDLYAAGDKQTFQGAINDAQSILDTKKTTSTDATRETDEPLLQDAITALNAAIEAFKASANIGSKAVVDIDFSNGFTAVDGEEDTYVVNGAAGQMVFGAGNVNTDNTAGGTLYSLGINGELEDVLRVGKSAATVEIPVTLTESDVIRASFDLWVGNLIKRYVTIELQNAAGERVGGFKLNRYEGTLEYNDFNNDDNKGLDILGYVTGIGSSAASNAAICVDANKSSFELIFDYKVGVLKGNVTNGKNGTCNGETQNFPALDDNKVAKFVLSSTYDNTDRRCWFDNLKVYKYESQGTLGITSVENSNRGASTAVYTLTGVKVADTVKGLKPGLYITNGKKYLVK